MYICMARNRGMGIILFQIPSKKALVSRILPIKAGILGCYRHKFVDSMLEELKSIVFAVFALESP